MAQDMAEYFGLLALVSVYLVLCWLVGVAAVRRGRSQYSFTVASFFITPLVAHLILLMMASDYRAEEIRQGRLVRCPVCAEWIQPAASKCRFCGEVLRPPAAAGMPAAPLAAGPPAAQAPGMREPAAAPAGAAAPPAQQAPPVLVTQPVRPTAPQAPPPPQPPTPARPPGAPPVAPVPQPPRPQTQPPAARPTPQPLSAAPQVPGRPAERPAPPPRAPVAEPVPVHAPLPVVEPGAVSGQVAGAAIPFAGGAPGGGPPRVPPQPPAQPQQTVAPQPPEPPTAAQTPPAVAEAAELAERIDRMRHAPAAQHPSGFYDKVLEWLHHADAGVRREAVRFLARHCRQSSDAQVLLEMVVADSDIDVRCAAAECLGGVFRATRNRQVNEVLASVVQNTEEAPEVRSAAYAAIRRINGY